jgi:hypothetical protein
MFADVAARPFSRQRASLTQDAAGQLLTTAIQMPSGACRTQTEKEQR